MEWLIKFILKYWLFFAVTESLFWGIRALLLYSNIPSQIPNEDRNRKIFLLWILEGGYQFIFNFVGSFAGWFCFYFLLHRIPHNQPWVKDFSGGDVLLFIISLLGLTGHLPQVTYGAVDSIRGIFEKVSKKTLG